MARHNKVCCVCGTTYSYCSNNCIDSLNKPTWMGSFCCENCRDIYNACSHYNISDITKQEAREILNKCDLSNKKNFTASTQKLIEEITMVESKDVANLKSQKEKNKDTSNKHPYKHNGNKK